MKTCAVIYNPKSGKKAKFNVMSQFEKILTDYGYESKIIYTKYNKLKNDKTNPKLIINLIGLILKEVIPSKANPNIFFKLYLLTPAFLSNLL